MPASPTHTSFASKVLIIILTILLSLPVPGFQAFAYGDTPTTAAQSEANDSSVSAQDNLGDSNENTPSGGSSQDDPLGVITPNKNEADDQTSQADKDTSSVSNNQNQEHANNSDAANTNPSAQAQSSESTNTDDQVVVPEPPQNAVAASDILPKAAQKISDEANSALRNALSPSLLVGQGVSDNEGAYLIQGSAVSLMPTLGYLRSSLEGGHLGARYDGDKVAFSFDAPYLYKDEKGAIQETTSPITWQQHNGQDDGMRAALVADKVPQGWLAYSQWDENTYVPLTDDDFKQGVSGHVVFIWQGLSDRKQGTDGQLFANSPMPELDARFAGNVPDNQKATITFGYEVHSFTKADDSGVVGNITEANAKTITVKNDKANANPSMTVERLAAPQSGANPGNLVYKVTYAVQSNKPAPTKLSLLVLDGYKHANNNQGGSAWDVTGVPQDKLFGIDIANEDALKNAGASEIQLTTKEDCALNFAIDANVNAGDTRSVLVVLPYDASDDARNAVKEGNGSVSGLSDESTLPFTGEVTFVPSMSFEGAKASYVSTYIHESGIECALAKTDEDNSNTGNDNATDSNNENSESSDEPEGEAGSNTIEEVPESNGEDSDALGAADAQGKNQPQSLDDFVQAFKDAYGDEGTQLVDRLSALMQASPQATGSLDGMLNVRLNVDEHTTAVEGMSNTYIIRKGAANPQVNVAFDYNYQAPAYIGNFQNPVTVTLNIPYMYMDASGSLHETYNKNEWEQNDLGNLKMRLKLSLDRNAEWEYYDASNGNTLIDDDDPRWTEGFTGVLTLKYVGNSYKLQPAAYSPQLSASFEGNVPENAGATIAAGLDYSYYNNGKKDQGQEQEIIDQQHIAPGSTANGRLTFINSNLEWEHSFKQIGEAPLWDKLNYALYEVRVKNTSKTTESLIDHVALDLAFNVGQTDAIRQEDLAAYKIEDGKIVPNENAYDPSATLIGKPFDNGVVIYNVTGKDDDYIQALQSAFQNRDAATLAQLEAEPLTYQSLQGGGHVNITIPRDEGGALQSKGDPENQGDYNESNQDELVLYFAFPFTTNLQPVNPGSEDPYYPPQKFAGRTTAYFGTNGVYQWAQERNNLECKFAYPKVSFDFQKSALDQQGTPQEETEGYLGVLSSYTLHDFSIKGNVPLFGPESKTSELADHGAEITDSLPKDFKLSNIEFRFNKAQEDSLQTKPDNWFAAEPVLFEIKGDSGIRWVSLGTLQDAGEDKASNQLIWRLGNDETEEQRLSTLIDNSLNTDAHESFTGRFRVQLRDGLASNQTMPGLVKINGYMAKPNSEFLNTAQALYDLKFWTPPVIEGSTHKEGYYKLNDRSVDSQAKFIPAVVQPATEATGYVHENDESITSDKNVRVPLNSEVSGFHFKLGNQSASKMQPATFIASGLAFTTMGGETVGFNTTRLTISNALLKHSSINSITFHRTEGDVTVAGDLLYSMQRLEDGSLVLGPSVWQEGHLTGFDVSFSSFDGTVSTEDEDVSIDVFGKPTQVATFTMTGTFSTAYEAPYEQQSATDSASLEVKRPAVDMDLHARYVDIDEATANKADNTDANEHQIAVPYDRDFALWAEIGNKGDAPLDDVDLSFSVPLASEAVTQADGSKKNAYTGFHTTGLTIKSELLDSFKEHKGELRFYDVANAATPAFTLTPVFGDNGVLTGFTDGTRTFNRNEQGDLHLPESDLLDGGLVNGLKSLVFYSWKGMPAETEMINEAVAFEGFSDANFGTETVLEASATNHFGGVRPTTGLAAVGAWFTSVLTGEPMATADDDDSWSATTTDTARIYTSKMYFDTSARAAFNDNDASKRFTSISSPDDAGHSGCATNNAFDQWDTLEENNKTLELGYKAQGSYLVDFRQYTNAWNELSNKVSESETRNLGNSKPYGKLLSGKTYNSAAQLTLTQNLPNNDFDAYYIKVNPNSIDYLKHLKVVYSDGSSWEMTPEDWADHTENAVETDVDGTPFMRINLIEPAEGDESAKASARFSSDKTYYSRDAFDDYGTDDFAGGALNRKTVKQIIYTLDINQDQYDDDTQGAVTQKANQVDFGTWYQWNDGTSSSLEVAGRFFRDDARDTNKVNQTVNARLEVGGNFGTNTHATKAVERCDDGVTAHTYGMSNWSFKDYYYHSDYSSWWNSDHYIAAHLSSTAKVDVIYDSNLVLKGVNGTPTYTTNVSGNTVMPSKDDNATFGADYSFGVAFQRKHIALDYNYLTPSYDYNHEDTRASDDWSGRISFADRVVLTDKLPTIRPDAIYGFYGFLTTGLRLQAGNVGFLNNMESITLRTKVEHLPEPDSEPGDRNVSQTTDSALDTINEGDAGEQSEVQPRTITLTKEQLKGSTDAD